MNNLIITRLTATFSGGLARGLPNHLTVYSTALNCPKPAAYPLAYDVAKKLNTAAAAHGRSDFSVRWAGQGAPLAREMPASKLIEQLVKEMQF